VQGEHFAIPGDLAIPLDSSDVECATRTSPNIAEAATGHILSKTSIRIHNDIFDVAGGFAPPDRQVASHSIRKKQVQEAVDGSPRPVSVVNQGSRKDGCPVGSVTQQTKILIEPRRYARLDTGSEGGERVVAAQDLLVVVSGLRSVSSAKENRDDE
jgi:hypothetical protein